MALSQQTANSQNNPQIVNSLGCIECIRRRLLLPVIAVSVRQSVSNAAQLGGACNVRGGIRCSLCQITLAPCFLIYSAPGKNKRLSAKVIWQRPRPTEGDKYLHLVQIHGPRLNGSRSCLGWRLLRTQETLYYVRWDSQFSLRIRCGLRQITLAFHLWP